MKHHILIGLLLTIGTMTLYAIPARRDGRIVQQSDGSTITVFAHGDETFHWLTDAQGNWLERNEQGDYKVVPALTTAQIQQRRTRARRYRAQQTNQATPLNIAPRGLIILVNFQDKVFTTAKAEMDSMINGQNYTRSYSYSYKSGGKRYTVTVQSEGSAREYFYNASFKQYHPVFDVVGPVTVSQKMSYYGSNDSDGNDQNAEQMIVEACKLAKSECNVDFTLYDNDNDSTVDFVYVFYAGYGEADSYIENTIWPHSYDLSAVRMAFKLDGMTIDKYACSNEMGYLSDEHDGIGTFCHEFSHVLGLPDLYITEDVSTTHKTLGEWDVMDYGPYNNDGNTPPNYSGYERFFMGWATPRLLTGAESVTLKDLGSSNEVLLISESNEHNLIGNDPNPTTFYLLENRQQTGLDTFLPGHGLMLTKVRYSYSNWYRNVVNNTKRTMGVDLIEADGDAPNYSSNDYDNGYYGKTTDLFPAGATSYSGIKNHTISNITEGKGVIYFSYEPSATPVENISGTSQQILSIYNILGQRMTTTNIQELTCGTYIIQTTGGSKKIVVP